MDTVAHGALGSDHRPTYCSLFERILADKPHPEMGYRSCLGFIRLADQYSPARVEAAAERAFLTGACRYQSVKSILKNSLDVFLRAVRRHHRHRLRTTTSVAQSISSEEMTMLKQPMIEKLVAMRLLGMADALKAQEQDPSARELSFLERFGLLVDQQWNSRENQALSRRLKNAKLRTPNACVEEIDYRTARGLDKSVIRSLTQQSAWVGTHENIFVLGPTGVGKSFVACALAQKACRDSYAALYTRAQSLFRDLAMARADGSLRSLPARLSHIDVLVIDDWPWLRCQNPSAATSGRSVRIAIRCARRS
jgi:DNA replication protein DnaC